MPIVSRGRRWQTEGAAVCNKLSISQSRDDTCERTASVMCRRRITRIEGQRS